MIARGRVRIDQLEGDVRKQLLISVASALVMVAAIFGTLPALHGSGEAASPDPQAQPVASVTVVGTLADQLTESGDPNVAMSSNPYDYAVDNPALDRLVSLGTPALPFITKAIKDSSANGLREYLLAIAAEKIARVDLKGGSTYAWVSGKEWPGAWANHLKGLPAAIDALAAQAACEERTAALVALGTPAIPYLMDRVAAGNTSLLPALRGLVQGTVEVPADELRGADIDSAWCASHAGAYDELRGLVQAAQ